MNGTAAREPPGRPFHFHLALGRAEPCVYRDPSAPPRLRVLQLQLQLPLPLLSPLQNDSFISSKDVSGFSR